MRAHRYSHVGRSLRTQADVVHFLSLPFCHSRSHSRHHSRHHSHRHICHLHRLHRLHHHHPRCHLHHSCLPCPCRCGASH
ncbi:unnamed protein product [Closterium sp. NIES-54]